MDIIITFAYSYSALIVFFFSLSSSTPPHATSYEESDRPLEGIFCDRSSDMMCRRGAESSLLIGGLKAIVGISTESHHFSVLYLSGSWVTSWNTDVRIWYGAFRDFGVVYLSRESRPFDFRQLLISLTSHTIFLSPNHDENTDIASWQDTREIQSSSRSITIHRVDQI